jgi:hypothetical protein
MKEVVLQERVVRLPHRRAHSTRSSPSRRWTVARRCGPHGSGLPSIGRLAVRGLGRCAGPHSAVVGPARVGDARGARLMLRRRLGLAHDPALTLERARTGRVPGA